MRCRTAARRRAAMAVQFVEAGHSHAGTPPQRPSVPSMPWADFLAAVLPVVTRIDHATRGKYVSSPRIMAILAAAGRTTPKTIHRYRQRDRVPLDVADTIAIKLERHPAELYAPTQGSSAA